MRLRFGIVAAIVAIGLAFLASLVLTAHSAAAECPPTPPPPGPGPPPPPMVLFGSVTIGGFPAPIDTVVIAEISGVQRSCMVTDEEGSYVVAVEGQTNGSLVLFRVNGTVVPETTTFQFGTVATLDLTAPAPPPVPAVSIWGMLLLAITLFGTGMIAVRRRAAPAHHL